ncbi:MAG TPA: hypothetical protein VMU14_10350 [Acidimicrobiales bacterium]|nr:hypothetical protein [Acidimicrobiales bacterium]
MKRAHAWLAMTGAPVIAAGVIAAAALLGVGRGSTAAGSRPSTSARMVCSPAGQQDIAGVLGASTTAPVVPTWSDHLYSCAYTYAQGRLLLSVKELATAASTTAFFTSMQARVGAGSDVAGIGQAAYQGGDGSVLVRKDFKVLVVDVSGLPPRIGAPPLDRATAALNVAAAVMGCWSGG